MEKNLVNFRKNLRDNWVFYTDKKLAQKIRWFVDVPFFNVYDPTCWQGNLLMEFDEETPKYGQEIFSEELEKAQWFLKNFTGECGDTLKNPKFMNMQFDCIVANPPFSIKWEPKIDIRFKWFSVLAPKSKADYAFILHCIHLLSENWIALILCHPWIFYRWNSEWKLRKQLIERNLIDKIVFFAPWYFIDTNISTCLLILKKNKSDSNIYFLDDATWDNRIVSYSEIECNDFDLWFNRYVFKEFEKPKIDPIELRDKARLHFQKKLYSDLAFEKTVCQIEWWEFQTYLDSLKNVIDSFRNKTI